VRLCLIPLTVALVFTSVPPSAAQVGTRPAKDWMPLLERPDRLAAMKIPEVVEKLELKAGDAVADLGAGTGVFSWPIAKAVAPGTVYAVEVDQDFVTIIQQRAKEQNIGNVRAVLGKFEDPMLPAKVDLAFFSDVLHHVANRGAYLKTVAGYLKPGGRIAVIELDATHPQSPHRDQPDQQVSKAQLDEWMTAAGLAKVSEIPLFEDKWFVIYRKQRP
jgi:ubiquinone/menaquinone biosynthesis C-methylase UbiE